MPKSEYAVAVDGLQRRMREFFRERQFKARGRTYNRETTDGLTQVVSIQMGASMPPGATVIPGLREDLHGLFTVNLGVFVPEVAEYHGGGPPKSWVQEYHCSIRARLGDLGPEHRDLWWPARDDREAADEITHRLDGSGLPFLGRFATRDQILAELEARGDSFGGGGPPRIIMAIIRVMRGETDLAKRLLELQALETHNPGHPEYVRKLASKLGLTLDQ